ncbi:unnamed protein product [Macrosiphum euphorbiae]|uniref:CCHC-type domain-containing protein n=1 Tax=Macrosiphum euphorbiae TaxID=13131 RepID=A0AAV0VWT0_9HEMI|nr:unnamed protein product [Macrosiphum euphorbiae]
MIQLVFPLLPSPPSIFESIDNIPQIEYVIAISKIIPPKNIKFVSRMSNNRFCVYFNDKNTVDLLIKNHPIIKLNDLTFIKIRRLVNPTKRIIISNVSPAIPNDKIIVELQNRNIQLLSPITHINAGFNIKDLAHILSFRRQVYINHDDFHKIPESLLGKAENELHRIFLTDDTLTCYKCKLTGHTSKLCKKSTPDPPNAMLYESSDLNNTTINTNTTEEKSGHIEPSIDIPSENTNGPNSSISPRRPNN